jgi:hypothetical protein
MGREALMVGNDPRNSQMGPLFRELAPGLAALLIFLVILSGVGWVKATHEAAAFNRVTTGPKVTTWDAVWLDLRVEAR